MRPPRYHFPDDVRSATRVIATKMKTDGQVAATPEELDAWVSRNPDIQERLVAGGYGSKFSADDLHPLLIVFVGGAIAPAQSKPARTTSTKPSLLLIGLAVLAGVAIAFLLLV